MSEAGWISLANTAATFILSIFILWTRWNISRHEITRREEHSQEVLKLDDIRKDIKEGTIAKRVAEIVADKMKDDLHEVMAEALTLMTHRHLGPVSQGGEMCPNCIDPVCVAASRCKNFKEKP